MVVFTTLLFFLAIILSYYYRYGSTKQTDENLETELVLEKKLEEEKRESNTEFLFQALLKHSVFGVLQKVSWHVLLPSSQYQSYPKLYLLFQQLKVHFSS